MAQFCSIRRAGSGGSFSGLCVIVFAAGILAVAAQAPRALACAACGNTLSQDFSTQGVNSAAGWYYNVNYSYLNQNDLRYGNGRASSPQISRLYAAGQEVEAFTRSQTVNAMLSYTGDAWGATLTVPYIMRSHGTDGTTNFPGVGGDLGANYTTSHDRGIGDVVLQGRYTGISEHQTSGVIFGVKLPTGSTSALFNEGNGANTPLDPGLQLGTGSTDLIFGGYATGNFGSYGWFAQATLQKAVLTQKDLAGNDYRPGNSYSFNGGIRYAVFGAKVSPMVQVNITRKLYDTGRDVPSDPLSGVPVTGGTLAYFAPGVSVRMGSASVYGYVQLPVYQQVNSLQLTSRYTLTVGVSQAL